MTLLPIFPTLAGNTRFATHPDCQESLSQTLGYYQVIGFNQPWICYYAEKDGALVGTCAFKGAPQNGRVEIAYATFPPFQRQGVATAMCRELVQLAQQADPTVLVTARTLPERSYSTSVLEKNGFVLAGPIEDPEDGTVWEWVFKDRTAPSLSAPRYVLAVKDLERSVCYYEEKLGFTKDWGAHGWQQLHRDRFVVMLGECSDDVEAFETRNHSYFAYVEMQNVDALHQEFAAKGVQIMYPLRSQPWGMREFGICTVDGHRIMFGEGVV